MHAHEFPYLNGHNLAILIVTKILLFYKCYIFKVHGFIGDKSAGKLIMQIRFHVIRLESENFPIIPGADGLV